MGVVASRAVNRLLPEAGPLRRLGWGTLLTSIGDGAWYTSWAIFLTRSVGISPAEVGLAITLAGALGLVLATPIGYLADRFGAREVAVVLLVLEAIGAASYLLVHGFTVLVPVACLAITSNYAFGGVRNALTVGLAKRGNAVGSLGSLRAVSHIGWAAGAAIGAVAIGINSRSAYVVLVLFNAATFLGYASLVARVPSVKVARTERGGPSFVVLRDRAYVTLAGLMGVLALCWGMLSSGVPLWVVFHTHAPHSISAIIVFVNAATIAAFQIRVSRGIRSPRVAARGAVLSGSALALSCVLFALTNNKGGIAAIALLLAAAAVHVAGELVFVAASWGLSIPLMPANAPGQYQGMFATGEAVALMAAPALMTVLVVNWGEPGWFILAAIFVAAPLLTLPATRWALRTRAAVAQSPA